MLGAGTCGIVFEEPGQPWIIKREKDHYYENKGLLNDFSIHQKVYQAIEKWKNELNIDIHVPQPLRYQLKLDATFWDEKAHLFPENWQEPADLLFAERILPMPKRIRDALIEEFCPAERRQRALLDPGNKSCLVRLYLGKQKQARVSRLQAFTLRNFQLHVDEAQRLQIEIKPLSYAMADALAVMHFDAQVDANDVEFVLGTAPSWEQMSHRSTPGYNFEKREVHFWLLDFNQVTSITMDEEGMRKAVKAFRSNDPYYPRPGQGPENLWNEFKARYLDTSAKIIGEDSEYSHLPHQFVEGVEEMQAEKIRKAAEAEARLQAQELED